uniref:CUB domain-containing protein n=1 Tax=Strongyloides stercoralis TaxID=6248 RepID=A0A0K0E5X6_STRER
MIFIGKMIIFLEFIYIINAYDEFRKKNMKENYLFYQNLLPMQKKSFDVKINYIKDCCAFIDKKGIYGTKSAQDNIQSKCIILLSTPSFNENMYLKFITSNVICKYYPNLHLNLTFPESNKKLKIEYCSMKNNKFPIYYKKAILEYEVIGLPIKFKLDFFSFDPVCGSKIQNYQIGQVITLKKPFNFQKPCRLILPGNSMLKILSYNFNFSDFISCIKFYNGRNYNEAIDNKKEICSNSITTNEEFKNFFDVSCSQGELVIDTFINNLNDDGLYKNTNFNETSITFIITKLPESDLSLLNSFSC